MTSSQSYREILEFLNKNKLDLRVIQEQFSRKNEEFAQILDISNIKSHFNKSLKNLDKITNSCEELIKFWTIIHNLTGGMRFQEVMDKLLNSRENSVLDLKSIGIAILRSKQAKPFFGTTSLNSIDEESWFDLLDLLQSDTRFIESARSMRDFQQQIYERNITEELQSILKNHPHLSKDDKLEFSKAFRKTGISIGEFLKSKYPNQKAPMKSRNIQTEKSEPKSDFDGYKVYMEADEREIARMKRTGQYSVRKRGKKRKRSSSP
jgi:hypothetical protein